MTVMLKGLLSQTVSDIICFHCQRYQSIYGEPPKVIAINSKLFGAIMMEDKHASFCGELIYFVASDRSVAAQPNKEWLMFGDGNWKFKEFV